MPRLIQLCVWSTSFLEVCSVAFPVDPPSSFSALSELVLLFVFYLLSVPCLVSGGVIVSQ